MIGIVTWWNKFWKRKFLIIACLVAAILTVVWFRIPRQGVIATYYDNPQWRGEPVFSRLEKEFSLRTYEYASDYLEFPSEQISIAWHGWLRIDHPGTYQFVTQSDDGSSVIVNNTLVVDNGGYHGFTEASGEIVLSAGVHKLNVNYFNGPGGDGFQISWRHGQGEAEQLIPTRNLFSRSVSPEIVWVTRYSELFYAAWVLAWAAVAGELIWQKWSSLRRNRLPVFLHGLLLAAVVITISVNLSQYSPLLTQPGSLLLRNRILWKIQLDRMGKVYGNIFRFPAEKKLSLLLTNGWRKSLLGEWDLIEKYTNPPTYFCNVRVGASGAVTGDASALFYETMRYLYAGRRLFLPEDTLFERDKFITTAGMQSVQTYHPIARLTAEEAAQLDKRLYHRFVYNPYIYDPDHQYNRYKLKNGHMIRERDHRCDQGISWSAHPILMMLIQAPKNSAQEISQELMAVQFRRSLYFVPGTLLPARLHGGFSYE